jgi:hypothetical protein
MESTARKAALLAVTTPRDNRSYYCLLDAGKIKPLTVKEVHLLAKGVVLIGEKGKIKIINGANVEEIRALQSLYRHFDFDYLNAISEIAD